MEDAFFSNNLSENANRPFAAGRKNWLFSDTPKGVEASAMIYTMVEMVKTHILRLRLSTAGEKNDEELSIRM